MIEREQGNIHVMMIKSTVRIVKASAHYSHNACFFFTTDIDECDREGAGEYPCDDDKEYCANSKGASSLSHNALLFSHYRYRRV